MGTVARLARRGLRPAGNPGGVKRAARDWSANGRAEAWLAHRGQRLAERRARRAPDIAAKLDAADRAYLAACRTREAAESAEREQARLNEFARAKAETDRAHAETERARAGARFARNLTAVFVVAALLLAVVGAWAWKHATPRSPPQPAPRLRRKSFGATQSRRICGCAGHRRPNTLVSSMVQKLRNVAGMKISLVQAILDPALKLQDQLIAAGESDPKLRRAQAVALTEAARTQLDVGDVRGAYASATRSRDILRELVTARPDESEEAYDLSSAFEITGDVAVSEGQMSIADSSYEDSLRIIERLAQSDPANSVWQLALARAYAKAGAAQLKRGRFDEASASYGRSLSIAAFQTQSSAAGTLAKQELSDAYFGSSEVQKAQGRVADRVQSLSRSLELLEGLLSGDFLT